MRASSPGTGFESLDALVPVFRDAPNAKSHRRSLAAAAALLVAVVLVVTPAGAALTDLVGIGSEPSEPPPLENENGIVIGTGEAFGSGFEVVATAGEDGTCVSIAFAGKQETGSIACFDALADSNADGAAALPVFVSVPDELSAEGSVLLEGVAGAEAASVVVRSGADTYPAQTFALSPELAQQIGSDQTGTFFYATLPRRVAVSEPPQSVSLEIRDASDSPIEQFSLDELPYDPRSGLTD